MIFFAIAVLAGVFTVVAPCILPLLPIVVGAADDGKRSVSKRAFVVIGSLALSVVVFTLLLKATTVFISIPQSVWTTFSGIVVIAVGIAIVFPTLWTRIPFVKALSSFGNKAVGAGYKKKSYVGDVVMGLALGPVFTTCSPTYLFIIATVLPAAFVPGFIYLLGFTFGLSIALFLIAYFGQSIVSAIGTRMKTAGTMKKILGVLIILAGVAILTGFDKKIETKILDSGYGATINLESKLIEKFVPSNEASNEQSTMNEAYETITLAGGCFWCTEAFFQEKDGVIDVVSGYIGGDERTASYPVVVTGMTKHREAVQVIYDPARISTKEILDVYWAHIDPTDTDGQFADTGFQYTTAIFYHDDAQKAVAEDSKKRLEQSGLFDKPVATQILPFTSFYKAEEYHQDYYKKSADHYERYKVGSGRAGFVEETWAKDAAIKFLTEDMTTNTEKKGGYNYTPEEIAEKLI
jgi:methionine-S-sulfoxide reductase